jgi:hypothetical protein
MNESGTYERPGNSATLKQGGRTFGTASISGGTVTLTITSGPYKGGQGVFIQ